MTFANQFLEEVQLVAKRLDVEAVERVVAELARVRERGGRLFILGVGGSAANASHAVNDFRKICGFECYAPTDNVSELTARTNDEGWANWRKKLARPWWELLAVTAATPPKLLLLA
jgi:D-sedoheptulose 7-phosphate isomerase